jgi:proline racemase
MGLKKGSAEGLADANRKEKEALEERTNLNTADSIALLGQELKSQKSAILPPAEAAKKEIEQKGMAKQADEATTKEEAKKKAQADQEAKSDASPVKTQESAESLLASLNTKIDQLIAVGKFQIAINERQLSASQAMSGDLHKMA